MPSRKSKPTTRDVSQRGASNPRIEITPAVAEYEQLCRDLKALRDAGAESNTAAILSAVGNAARGGKVRSGSRNGKGAQTRPQPDLQQEV